MMNLDPQFSTMKLYHTIFPAITFYKLFHYAGLLDLRVGQPLGRILRWMDRKGFEGWKDIHRTRLNEAEEDEQLFVYAFLSPVLTLLFPFIDELFDACHVDALPEIDRVKLMGYYRDCLQRHLFATGPEKTLLVKNTTMTGRLRATIDAFPDLRIVHVVRAPKEAIPSLLSMYDAPWKALSPSLSGHRASRALARLYCQYYGRRRLLEDWLPASQLVVVNYENLVSDPLREVERVYAHFRLAMDPTFQDALSKEAKNAQTFRSRHTYSPEKFGITAEEIKMWVETLV